MQPKKDTRALTFLSPQRIARSVGHAWQGLGVAAREEQNFRLELLGTLLVSLLSWWLATPFVPLFLCCMLIMALELINSALESLLDLLHPTPHPLVKKAKDMAAAAVLLLAIGTAFLAAYYFLPALWQRLV